MPEDERELRNRAEGHLRIALKNLHEACNQLEMIGKESAEARAIGGMAAVLAAVMDMCHVRVVEKVD